MESLIVYGAGGHGKVVAEAALSSGWDVRGFVDDNPAKQNSTLLGKKIVAIGAESAVTYCRQHRCRTVVALGNNRARHRTYQFLVQNDIVIATVIHPAATVSPSAQIGDGTVVFAGVTVNADTVTGASVILNTGCTVDHDNTLDDCAHIAPGAHTGGGVSIGTGTHIGIGASIRNNIHIGAWSTIGAGAVVVKNIPDSVVAFGNPARIQWRVDGPL